MKDREIEDYKISREKSMIIHGSNDKSKVGKMDWEIDVSYKMLGFRLLVHHWSVGRIYSFNSMPISSDQGWKVSRKESILIIFYPNFLALMPGEEGDSDT